MICFVLPDRKHNVMATNQLANIRKYNPDSRIVLCSPEDTLFDASAQPAGESLNPGSGKPNKHVQLLNALRWLTKSNLAFDYAVIDPDPRLMFIKDGFEAHIKQVMDETDDGLLADFMQLYSRRLVERMLDETNDAADLASLAMQCGGKLRTYPAEASPFLRTDRPLVVDEVQKAQSQTKLPFVYPVLPSADDPARQWVLHSSQAFPSNLTIVWGCYQGGVETALHYRLKALNALGAPSHAYFYEPGMGLPNYRSIPHRVSAQKDDLGSYIEHYGFDCVTFVNTFYNFEQLSRIDYKGKVIFEFHGYDTTIAQQLNRINVGEDGGRIDALVVPSEYVAQLARDYMSNRPELPVYVARNMLDTTVFLKRENIEDLLIDFHLPKSWAEEPLIGWVGRLDENKNWKSLLSIFQEIKKINKKAKLLAVSDLSVKPQLYDFYGKAAEYGLTADIRILSNVPHGQMPLYYSLIAQSGGVLLSTSYSEGYPYHLLEAAACECPMVCSDNRGSREIVKHQVSGLIYPLDRADLAVAYIAELFYNKAMRRQLTDSARKYVVNHNDIMRHTLAYAKWLADQTRNTAVQKS
ncbi:glycosyltransferase family 4 protein [Paenibacillus thalictri]|uniref:Glycosyltransferase n=1 Tax=Paenibacillus thalictri TaxID=2527873 RepID=A0A4Q9DRY5_9BACL|nr:glycosyltransferase family 4 protein [Paenibacillus thalictri]TBL78645.1 glycosyltransferase [Paenibacillus thalictri]